MRIALVLYGSLDQQSGGYFYDRKLVAYLQHRGDKIDILSLPSVGYGRALLHAPLAAKFEYGSYDVVIQDELVHPSLWIANRWYRRKRKRSGGPALIALVHHLRVSEAHPVWSMPLYRWVEGSFLSSVDGFICNTPATKENVWRLFPNEKPSVVALPSGNFPRKKPSANLNTGDGPLNLLFVGNVIPRKGLHTLLQALVYLEGLTAKTRAPQGWSVQNPVGKLLVVGNLKVDPAYVQRCKTLAEQLPAGMVQFLGSLSDEELLPRFEQSQILAVPSRHEGFGIVYLEAMGQGLVPIASADGGASILIDHGQNGFLVRPEDPEQIAEILVELGNDRNRLAWMRRSALERAAVFPDWEASMEAAYNFIHDMAREDLR
mgnify:FL=1